KEANDILTKHLEDEDVCYFSSYGKMINSGFLTGLRVEDAIAKMIAWLEEKKLGTKQINFKLRDWVFSRQRYWGEPIPLVHCDSCGIVPLNEADLPMTLPEVDSYTPTGTGESPLAAIDEWVNTTCPKCAGKAKRETNTMPQWAGSCWYYLRYLDPHNTEELASKEKIDYWMPVDLYVGGAEHAVLHLLYARFWHKVLFDIGVVSQDEPFQQLINQGMILGEGGIKMSKSLGNVINPDIIIDELGADTMRLYEMFMGPLTVSKPWSTKGTAGVHRFLDRVWRVSEREITNDEPTPELLKVLHQTIKKVSVNTSNLEFNTAIAQMMIFINEVFKSPVLYRKIWEPFVLLLSPYAPHIGEELWEKLGHKDSLAYESWPRWEEELVKESVLEVVLKVNGKVRAKIELPAGTSKDDTEKAAFENEKIKSYTDGKIIVKVIVVPDKLVNIVVR
ncbi:MAG: class I tRNA ligase family protein, partial [Spirochaetales bacterium]|nr:class I tRNA ligase family protein [Spirochaetales bacterium]